MTEDDTKLLNESIQAAMEPAHRKILDNLSKVSACLKGAPALPQGTPLPPAIEANSTSLASPVNPRPWPKGGRPKGFNGQRSKMPSAMAIRFKQAGLEWQTDFALAIKANNKIRIKLWLKLLPYLITTSSKAKVRSWKGKPSKAALIALETLEGRE